MRKLLLALCLALPSIACAQAGTFGLADEDPYTGSNIRKRAVTWSVPLDKRYEELTPEQVKTLRSMYPALGEGDKPPFPKLGMAPLMKEIMRIHRAAMITGDVDLRVKVDAQGTAQQVAVYKTPDPKLARAIAYYLVNAEYKPARCGGTPCEMEFRFLLALRFRD